MRKIDYIEPYFHSNPNLYFVEELKKNEKDKIFINNNIIEIYYPKNISNELYLIIPNNKSFNIDIIRILDNKTIKSLKGHNDYILSVRHFYNSKDKFDYLLSVEACSKVFIWDLTNNYKLKFTIEINYTVEISDSLIIFDNYKNKDYILISTYSNKKEDYSKLFSFEDKGKFITNIPSTNLNMTYYLIKWNNTKENNDVYIIECCYKIIYIYNLYNPNLNFKLKPILHESKNCSGYIIKKDNIDYLWTISYNGYINIFNLYSQLYIANIYIGYNYGFCNIVQWNKRYIIISIIDRIKIIDIYQKKIINNIILKGTNEIYLKKIMHPYYNESLLTIESNSSIKLWTKKNNIIRE